MVEKECSSFNSSADSNMSIELQDKKDVSKVFTYLRNKLNAKEKELLELQRAQPCLLSPDSQQIDGLIDCISSLHLTTQDGSFVFASTSNESSTNSTDVHSIKILPSTTDSTLQQNQYRLPMVTQLLSLPVSAFVKSSSTVTSMKKDDEPSNRLPMVSQIMAMPISAFTSPNDSTSITTDSQPENRLPMVTQMMNMPISAFRSSTTTVDEPSNRLPVVNQLLSMPISAFRKTSPSVQIEEKKATVTKQEPKSILTSEKTYSKEHWLKRSSSPECESDFVHLDLDQYIEQSTEKMRRLHLEYLQAIEKINTPTTSDDSVQTLKSIYPQMFERLNEDLTPKSQTLEKK